jgi:hypothetical protein
VLILAQWRATNPNSIHFVPRKIEAAQSKNAPALLFRELLRLFALTTEEATQSWTGPQGLGLAPSRDPAKQQPLAYN